MIFVVHDAVAIDVGRGVVRSLSLGRAECVKQRLGVAAIDRAVASHVARHGDVQRVIVRTERNDHHVQSWLSDLKQPDRLTRIDPLPQASRVLHESNWRSMASGRGEMRAKNQPLLRGREQIGLGHLNQIPLILHAGMARGFEAGEFGDRTQVGDQRLDDGGRVGHGDGVDARGSDRQPTGCVVAVD